MFSQFLCGLEALGGSVEPGFYTEPFGLLNPHRNLGYILMLSNFYLN